MNFDVWLASEASGSGSTLFLMFQYNAYAAGSSQQYFSYKQALFLDTFYFILFSMKHVTDIAFTYIFKHFLKHYLLMGVISIYISFYFFEFP